MVQSSKLFQRGSKAFLGLVKVALDVLLGYNELLLLSVHFQMTTAAKKIVCFTSGIAALKCQTSYSARLMLHPPFRPELF